MELALFADFRAEWYAEHLGFDAVTDYEMWATDAESFMAFARSLPRAINTPAVPPLTIDDIIDFDLCWAFDFEDPWGNRYELNCYDHATITRDLITSDGITPVRYWPRRDKG